MNSQVLCLVYNHDSWKFSCDLSDSRDASSFHIAHFSVHRPTVMSTQKIL